MDTTPELESALLQWVNSFTLPKPVNSWKEFRDGTVFWKILGQTEPDYFGGVLPESSTPALDNWVLRWQNLKFINRKAQAYIRDECDKLHNLGPRMNPDLKAMAMNGSKKDTLQLLQIILLAAMYSPASNERMVTTMESLGAGVAIPIAQCIETLERMDQEAATMLNDSSEEQSQTTAAETRSMSISVQRDPEMVREEEVLKTHGKLKNLEDENIHLSAELATARSELAKLQEQLTTTTSEVASEVDVNTLRQLRETSIHDKEHITDLEAEVTALKNSSEEYQRQVERLRSENQSKQSLRDELQLVKMERDELAQTARANENLKRKISALTASNKATGDANQALEKAQRDIKTLQNEYAAIRKTNEERQKTIENSEQAISDQRTARKRVDHELNLLNQKLVAAETKGNQDLDLIQEQRERIRDLESSSHDMVSNSLHHELAQDTRVKELVLVAEAKRKENKELLLRVDILQRNVEEQKELFRLAILEHAGGDRADELKNLDEYKIIAGQLETLKTRPGETDSVIRLLVARIDNKRHDTAGVMEGLVQQNDQHKATITDLEDRLAAAQYPAQKESADELQLRRELDLMSSAWYDLSNRLQSDAVTIQRRSEAPRSFLNRQRKIVNNPTLMKQQGDDFSSFRKPSYLTPPGGR